MDSVSMLLDQKSWQQVSKPSQSFLFVVQIWGKKFRPKFLKKRGPGKLITTTWLKLPSRNFQIKIFSP